MVEPIAADMDGGWKQLMEEYLEEFFHFYFPAIHAGIDFAKRMCVDNCRIWDRYNKPVVKLALTVGSLDELQF